MKEASMHQFLMETDRAYWQVKLNSKNWTNQFFAIRLGLWPFKAIFLYD